MKTLEEAQRQIREFKSKDRIPEADQYVKQLNELSVTLELFKEEVGLIDIILSFISSVW